MSDSTTPSKDQRDKIVVSEDPFERELQKRIRNQTKKLDNIAELEKKVKKKEIKPNED
jgi:hypothetical protein